MLLPNGHREEMVCREVRWARGIPQVPMRWGHNCREARTMGADEIEREQAEEGSLEERVRELEVELGKLRRKVNIRNWVVEALLVMILLMGATAWWLWRG